MAGHTLHCTVASAVGEHPWENSPWETMFDLPSIDEMDELIAATAKDWAGSDATRQKRADEYVDHLKRYDYEKLLNHLEEVCDFGCICDFVN